MSTTDQPLAEPFSLVIFGATGDLTRRKLVPALYNLALSGLLPDDYRIVGVARSRLDLDEFRTRLGAPMRESTAEPVDEALWQSVMSRVRYVGGELTDPETYQRLSRLLTDEEAGMSGTSDRLYYLATPPDQFAVVAAQLAGAGLARTDDPSAGWRRLVVEKPFGRDLASARRLNQELLEAFDESQIYRIDHYLGKETVQNVLVFRFANGIFEPIWNRRYIDHVQITSAEDVGIEGRGGYYETAGALRDMIQNHLFQLLALVAMEPPISFDGDAIRDQKVRALQAIRPMDHEEIIHHTARGQYGPGTVPGQRMPGYRQEPKVDPESTVETFAAVQLFVENWRWADVPFYLRAGKRLPHRVTEIVIQFRRAPVLLFRSAGAANLEPNRLILRIQPDERIEVHFQAKKPGAVVRLTPAEMSFRHSDLGTSILSTGYETLLFDALQGDATLFHRADMVEAAWKVATPILDVWQALPPRDFPNYAAGTWGPPAADRLLERDQRHWHNG